MGTCQNSKKALQLKICDFTTQVTSAFIGPDYGWVWQHVKMEGYVSYVKFSYGRLPLLNTGLIWFGSLEIAKNATAEPRVCFQTSFFLTLTTGPNREIGTGLVW